MITVEEVFTISVIAVLAAASTAAIYIGLLGWMGAFTKRPEPVMDTTAAPSPGRRMTDRERRSRRSRNTPPDRP
jgi:hypothetical protein